MLSAEFGAQFLRISDATSSRSSYSGSSIAIVAVVTGGIGRIGNKITSTSVAIITRINRSGWYWCISTVIIVITDTVTGISIGIVTIHSLLIHDKIIYGIGTEGNSICVVIIIRLFSR